MSWLFSQALVAAFSADTCSAGDASAQLSVMPTQHPFSRKGRTMDFCLPSPFGLTCRVLTDDSGEAVLTSYLRAFPAKTYRPQERAPVSKANEAGCGPNSSESVTRFDPLTSRWKTAQCSLLADSDEFSGTWPRSGSMRSGVCSARPDRDSRTAAIASGYGLPTPSGVNGGRNNTMGRVDEWGGSSNPLRGTVIGSMCSPEFEEMVMGWPIGWTELTPFATGKFREWQREHGASSVTAEEAA